MRELDKLNQILIWYTWMKNVGKLSVYTARENSSMREPFEECLNYKLHKSVGSLEIPQSFGQ